MPKCNAISSIAKSQDLFSINALISTKSDFFYVKNDNFGYDFCEKNFFQLLNIPKLENLDSYQDYPKLLAVHDIEKKSFLDKTNREYAFAYCLSENQYKLFIIKSELTLIENNPKIISYWSSFSKIYCREDYLTILGFNEIELPDDGFPIHLFKETNPFDLCDSGEAWSVAWFFILGKSIRWIVEFLDITKKIVEKYLNDLYINSGIMNKKNLLAIAYKYKWLDFINTQIIHTINITNQKNKKTIF